MLINTDIHHKASAEELTADGLQMIKGGLKNG